MLKKVKKVVRQVSGWSKFRSSIKPLYPFAVDAVPAAPDYNDLFNWVAHPSVNSNVHFTPQGIFPNDAWKNGEVDVFYLYPTLNFSNFGWNASLTDASVNELVEQLIMSGQASVFNSCCRIFAPRYRQATFFSFLGAGKNSRQALELAYQDCLTAFDFYLKNFNNGRPFFLAGHSQGALHTIRLMEERVDADQELLNKMVAAYPIGFWLPTDKFGTTLKNIIPAESATQTCCVVAYDTYLEGGSPIYIADRAEMVYAEKGKVRWERRAKKTPLGVNPLSWNRSLEKVPASQHRGAVHLLLSAKRGLSWEVMAAKEPSGIKCTGLSAPFQEEASARIGKDGILYVSEPRHKAFRKMVMPGGNLHLSDFSLFYMNLRANIQQRWDSFNGKNISDSFS